MQFFLIQLPDGRTIQVRASGPADAIQTVKNAYANSNLFGPGELEQIQVREAPSSQPFAATTPALNFAVQDYSQGTGVGEQGTPTQEQPVTSPGPGGPGGGTTYDPTVPSNPEAQAAYTEQAYRRGIEGAGYDFDKFGGQALKNRFAPTYTNFRWNTMLNQGLDTPVSQDIEGYSKANAGTGRSIYNRASELFNTIVGGGAKLGLEGKHNNAIYAAVGDTYNPETGKNETDDPTDIRGELLRLARTAAFRKWGAFGSGGPSNESLYDDFDKQVYAAKSATEAGGTQAAGIDWSALLKRRLGL